MQSYDEQSTYHKQLQKTEKLQLYNGGTTKAMLTAIYLYTPTFKKKDRRDEVFIVGIYLEDEASQGITAVGNSLTLNGHAAKDIAPLDPQDERLAELSLVTPWSSYYLVTFPHVESKKLTLIFKSRSYGEGMLHFAKVAKYVLEKEIF